mmetsp:Transcript_81341/g.228097  ORF Transcript_81341/g.228097 Transcript_81341/m.228097 type:complete len:255 (-) Transcript_81341:703-1467(-)
MPTVASKVAFVAPAFMAMAMPCIISAASLPTMWHPTTRPAASLPSLTAMSFMRIFSSSPRPVGIVCFIGLKVVKYTSTLPYRLAASASVRPQLPMGGWLKTALGTFSWSGFVGSSPNIVLAMAMPSINATGVNAMRSVTSPMAKMDSTFVLLYSSTRTLPLLSSNATPASSRPIAEELGFRPVANMTLSATTSVPLSVLKRSLPSPVASMEAGFSPLWTWMPLAASICERCDRTSSSKPRSGRSARYTRCTSVP